MLCISNALSIKILYGLYFLYTFSRHINFSMRALLKCNVLRHSGHATTPAIDYNA